MTQPNHPGELASPIRVVWPPPGLERSQGVFWRTAIRLGFGGGLLAIPVLVGVTISQPIHSIGLFGSASWILGVTSALGLLIVIGALAGLFSFFRTAGTAAVHGIDLQTVLQVGADHDGEMGALIQGTRSYRSLGEGDRDRAVRARIWASLFFLSGGTWLAVGWILSLLLASRGLLGPSGVWALAMGPAGLAALAGTVAKGVEGTALQRAFGPWIWIRWRNAGQRDAAEIWGDAVRRFREGRGERVKDGRRMLLTGAFSTVGLAALMVIPAASFTVVSLVGPTLASMAVPQFSATAKRAATVEALRDLRLPPNPGISPMEAGEAHHALTWVGRWSASDELLRAPVRSFEAPFFPDGAENPLGVRPEQWSRDLFPLIAQGVSSEGEAFLREIAAHAGLAEYETVALAPAIDVLGARLRLPIPIEISAMEIPFPRFSPVREGGYAMVAKAAVQFMDGDPDAAEHTLRVLVSAGILLGDESPTLIDALIGFVLAGNAADALEGLYAASGRQEDADRLRKTREVAERAADELIHWSSAPSPAFALRGMPAKVTSERMLRGIRWEYLHLLTGLSPCVNPHQVVFGPDEASAEFLRSARTSLVRYPSEAAIFEVMERGWLDLPEPGGLERALVGTARTLLGGRAGRCAALLGSGVF